MARFDLNSYDPVDSRLEKFWAEHENGAVVTELVSDPNDIAITVFKASIYFNAESGTYEPRPNGVGYAQGRKDGPGMADRESWLEVAETSAIGRALANCGYKSKIDSERPSQEEMVKAGAFERPAPVQAQGYSRTGPSQRASEGETFPDHFARNMKTVDLVEFAKEHDFRGTSVRALKDEIEQTFKVKIGGTAPDGGCLPVDVGNALAYYVNKLSNEQKEVIAASVSDEGADGLF